MITLRIQPPDLTSNYNTQVSLPCVIGVTNLYVFNTQGLVQNNLILVDPIGNNLAEVVQINAPISSPNELTITPTANPHGMGANVTFTPYNQIRIYKNSALYDTVNIVWNQIQTNYQDADGTPADIYTVSYYNSITSLESAQTNPIQGDVSEGNVYGYNINSLFNLLRRIRSNLNDPQAHKWQDQELIDAINVAVNKVTLFGYSLNDDYGIITSNVIPFTSTVQEYLLPLNNYKLRYVRTAIDGINYIYSEPTDLIDLYNVRYALPIPIPVGQSPYIYFQYAVKGVSIIFYPPPQSGTYILDYQPLPQILTQDSDILFTPINIFGEIVLNGACVEALKKSGNAGLGKKGDYQQQYDTGLEQMVTLLKDRQLQKPKRIRFSDTAWLGAFD